MKRICRIMCYPNKNQIEIIEKNFGGARFVYNLYLEILQSLKEANEGTPEFISFYEFNWLINRIKYVQPYEWLQQVSSKAISGSIKDVEKNMKAFFKRKYGYPKFRSKNS